MRDWRLQLEAEFDRAEKARASGNEGQARVCARRAAGIAVREYYSRLGRDLRTPSALDLLVFLLDDPKCAPRIKQSATYLTMRVNEEFKLPEDVDLVAEARRLCNGLLSK